jgi:hypothetical protein
MFAHGVYWLLLLYNMRSISLFADNTYKYCHMKVCVCGDLVSWLSWIGKRNLCVQCPVPKFGTLKIKKILDSKA